MQDIVPPINNGYPIFKWQDPDAAYVVTLMVTPQDASVVFNPDGSGALTPGSAIGGVYVFSGLNAGAYEYTVSEDARDYIPENGSIVISYGDVDKTVTLAHNLYPVVFNVEPDDATVSITQAGFEDTKAAVSGTTSFMLPMGSYSYSVDKFGYIPASGSVTVAKDTGVAATPVTITEAPKHDITFTLDPSDATIVVTHATGGVQTATDGTTYSLYEGNTYTYTVKRKGYVTQTDTVTVGSSNQTIPVTLLAGITPWDGVTMSEPALTDGVYQISDAEELAWFRDKVNSQLVMGTGGNGSSIINSSTSSTINAILLDTIDLGGFEWVPIGIFTVGTYSANAPYGFAGTFDGNGNTIRGLSITTGANGSGLFGVLMGGMVKNLTVEGSIVGGQYTGGIAGYSNASTKYPAGTTISGCVSNVDITVEYAGTSSTYVGGITGYMSNTSYSTNIGLIENCINYGDINGGTSNRQIYFGGIIGSCAYGLGVQFCGNEGNITGVDYIGGIAGSNSSTVIGCYNTGSITASASANGVGGIVGESSTSGKTKECYNTGTISGTTRVGGIVGYMNDWTPANVVIENCYNAGAVTASAGTVGGVIGEKRGSSGGVINNVVFSTYYLAGTAATGIGGTMAHADDIADEISGADLKKLSTAARIGTLFASVADAYPVLRWQTTETDVIVLFDVTPADAEITVKDDTEQTMTPAEGENCYVLSPGSYTYQVKKTAYKTVNQPLALVNTNAVIPIVLVANDQPADPIDIVMSYQQDSTGFLIARQTNTIPADLSEDYGYNDSYNGIEITALDAIVAAHIEIFGDDPTVIATKLAVDASGMITNFMGDGEGNMLYFVDGVSASVGVCDYLLEGGDLLELFAVRDPFWSDPYGYFAESGAKIEAVSALTNTDLTLNLQGDVWGAISPVEGARIVVLDTATGLFGAPIGTTDANGDATVQFSAVGTYIVGAIEAESTTPLMSPWLVVTVAQAPSDPVDVTISYQADDSGFWIAPKSVSVNPGLSEQYGYIDDYAGLEVSALDVIVAAHIAVFGDDETDIHNALEVTSAGFLTNFMGDGLGAFVCIVNNVLGELTADKTLISDGDFVQLFSLQDVSMWSDTYTWFEANGQEVKTLNASAGVPFELTLTGIEYIVWGYDDVAGISNAEIVSVEMIGGDVASFDATLATTDANGATTITFTTAGTYILSAVNSGGGALMSPWLVVTVTDTTPTVDKTALNTLITMVEALAEADYTAESWSALQTALTAAKAVATNDTATQTEVDEAKSALQTAFDSLESAPIPADKSALNTLITAVEALTEADYTPTSWSALQTALNSAKTVVANDAATQTEIDDAKSALQTAFDNLSKALDPCEVVLEAALAKILQTVPAPAFDSEWSVLALARAGYSVPSDYYEEYYARIVSKVQNTATAPKLHATRTTDNSRLILALTSIGIDPTNVGGYNLIAPLADYDWVTGQGVYGPVYALLALDSKNYTIPTDSSVAVQTTRENLVAFLLTKEVGTGGFALVGSTMDIDTTSMVLQALVSYKNDPAVASVIERALTALSAAQNANGSFGKATQTAESIAQVIVALTALDIDPATDSRFVKTSGNPIEALLSFAAEGGGFKHLLSQTAYNPIATDQGAYALVAYDRYLKSQNRLYDMTDVGGGSITAPEADKTMLQAAINLAEALTEADYTAESWSALQTAFAEAKAVAADALAIQAEVDDAKTALLEAIDALVQSSPSVNKSLLNAAIAQAEALTEADYVSISWTEFSTALTTARDIAAKTDATKEEVESAVAALLTALDSLVQRATATEKSALDSIIAQAESLAEADYTAESWNALQSVLVAAKAVAANIDATQTEVIDARAALSEVISGLEHKPASADKTALNAAITQAEIKTAASYTTTSWNVMQTALTAAKTVANDADATQEQVDTAKDVLLSAINALVPVGSTGGNTITVHFTLKGDSAHGEGAVHGNTLGGLQTWIARKSITVDRDATVADVIKKAIDEAGITWDNPTGGYIKALTRNGVTIGEFTNGPNSGWLFTLNNTLPIKAINEQDLKNGDSIILYYTDDYTKEDGMEKFTNGTSSGGDTETSSASSTITPQASVKDGKASASVTAKQVSDAIKAAKENKTNVVIKPNLSSGTATRVSVDIPKKSVEETAKEGVDLQIETPAGSVTFDQKAQTAITGAASSDTITIIVEQIENETLTEQQREMVNGHPVVDLTVVSGGKVITDFKGGKAYISIPYELKPGEKAENLVVWYIADDGTMTEIPCKYNASAKCVEFTAEHFSTYAVGYNAPEESPVNPFTDVASSDWFYDAVNYVFENDLMKGISNTIFAPDSEVTRAMLVTILYRHEGEPPENGANPFSDVEAGQWYTDAISWAVAYGIVEGFPEGTFAPDNALTREQIVTILYRYAQKKGLATTKRADLSKYTDEGEIADWAQDAMAWANAEGVLNGRSETMLAPNGTATRAEIAALLMRFIQNIMSVQE